ncbi:MAG: serine/threonine protein kinase [Gammaproteobacteria bacterium]|jgi:serine/threonine protein kinase
MAQPELRNSLKTDHQLHWYRIDSVLGQGGFGITYLAYDPNLDQHVAIKEYLPMDLAVRDGDNSVYPASSANRERYQWGLDRFISEARTLAKFKHPAIVRVLSVFEENNTAYMVMEYERGKSLQQILDTRKTLNEDELIPILGPLLDGLEQMHSTGFIHRDIKPANIYVREDGSPVLLDFGSARQALGEQTKSLTSIVSPGYAPFEQYYSKSDRQGPWTDIYSLAATMYRAISGIMPMDAIDRSEAILKAERDIFVSAGEIGEGRYSVGFMRALDHALNFSEKKRPQTIGEWRAELGIESRNSAPVSRQSSIELLGNTLFESPSVIASEIETRLADSEIPIPSVRNSDAATMPSVSTPLHNTAPSSKDYAARPRPSKWWWIIAAVAILAIGATGVWVQTAKQDSGDPESIRNSIAAFVASISGDRLESLVSRGDRALSAGLAFEPSEGSALSFYRQAIALAPGHEGALQGIALVAARMIPAVELAIAERDLGRALQLLQTLRALPGQGQAIEFVEQEYALVQAENAANAVQSDRIKEFLNEAATDFAEGRLLEPSGNNALVRYRAIQVLDPDNSEATRGIAAIAAILTEQFDEAVSVGNYAVASRRLREMKPLHPDLVEFNKLSARLEDTLKQTADANAQQSEIEGLLRLAAADLQANRLSTPSSRNALARYNQVLKLDPGNSAATTGLFEIGERYKGLARASIQGRRFDAAKDLIARARTLKISSADIKRLSSQLQNAQTELEAENTERTLAEERQRLALEAETIRAQERLRAEMAEEQRVAELEKRRRQEREAKRLFEIEQERAKAASTVRAAEREVANNEAAERSTLVVEFDGFSDDLSLYGVEEREIRADIEGQLRSLGYNVVLHHEANRSTFTRLFLIRFRANLNSASGVFSYAASLALYPHVPAAANSVGQSGQNPLWTKGVSGVAVQMQLRRVRDEYIQIMRLFKQQVGQAPGRL